MNAPVKRVHSGMMLETPPMPGTRAADALKKSKVPSIMEVIGGVGNLPRFVLILIFGSILAAIAFLTISIGIGA